MKKNHLRKILLFISLLAASTSIASSATAATDPWNSPAYPLGAGAECGDGKINVAVAYEKSQIEEGGPFYQRYNPRGYSPYVSNSSELIKDTTNDNIYAPHWPYLNVHPTDRGEMCDGTEHTVLCYPNEDTNRSIVTERCTIINNTENLSLDDRNRLGVDSCYSLADSDPLKCGKGVGNGIIQPLFGEECDDGNNTDGDGCNRLGKFENQVEAISSTPVCGNGVIEGIEKCDDGNTRNGDGCSSECREESPSNAKCTKINTCGNGKVEPFLGEQCDGGPGCTEKCQRKSDPHFSSDNYAYWVPDGADVTLDTSSSGADGSKVIFLKEGMSFCSEYKCISPSSNPPVTEARGAYKIGSYGQVIELPYWNDHQLSGVFLSGQKISELANTDIYPDQTMRLHMVVSQTSDDEGKIAQWDDDAFGLVIGMKEGNQTEAAKDPNYKYLMLSWRSYLPAGWGEKNYGYNRNPKSQCGNIVKAAPAGLRLYEITGAPNYLELWQMKNCGNSSEHIKEITTWNENNVGSNLSEVINPFINLNTTYALNFNYGNTSTNQRLQIELELTAEELKVYVNRQPAIHIKRNKLEAKHYKWPTEGELGYYILGMDNITADFRGYQPRTENDAVKAAGIDDSTKRETTICSNVCGDMIKDPGEECDDGNRIDGDGCESSCKFTNKTQVCKDVGSHETLERLCFGGEILFPTTGQYVTTEHPVILGSYVGNPANIQVNITDEKTGDTLCSGTATKDKNSIANETLTYNAWKFATAASCPSLVDGNEYTVTATFNPMQSAQGQTFDPIESKTTFVYESSPTKPQVTINSPLSSNIYVADNNTPIKLDGTCHEANEVKIKLCNTATNKCEDLQTNPSPIPCTLNRWTAKIPTLGKSIPQCLKQGTCQLEVVAHKTGGESSIPSTRKLVATPIPKPQGGKVTGDIAINYPLSTLPNEVKSNAGNTLTVEGTFTTNPNCRENNSTKCAPKYVKVELSCTASGIPKKDVIVAEVNAAGKYSVELPVHNCQGQSGVTITATGYVDLGNTLSEVATTSKSYNSTSIRNGQGIQIFIECPQEGRAFASCPGGDVQGYINANTQKKVDISYYEKQKKDEKCNFENKKKVKQITVVTNNKGQWKANLGKSLVPGYYCLQAKTESYTDVANAFTTAKVSTEVALSAPTSIHLDKDKDQWIVPAPKGGNISEGDSCEIKYEYGGVTVATGQYEGNPLSCKASASNTPHNPTNEVYVRNTRTSGAGAPPSTWTPLIPIKGEVIDGSQLEGEDPNKQGTIVYTTEGQQQGTVIVEDLKGFSAGEKINLEIFDKDGVKQSTSCTVSKTGKTCVTTVPSSSSKRPTKIVAKTTSGSGTVIDTWFAKPDGGSPSLEEKQQQPTVSYVSANDNHVIITIPKEGAGKNLKEKDTIKLIGPNGEETICSNLELKRGKNHDYFECKSSSDFLDKYGNRINGEKVKIFRVYPTPAYIGSAFIYSGTNSSTSPLGGGIVAGGCGCASSDTPASGFLSLLLTALGLFAFRRRRNS